MWDKWRRSVLVLYTRSKEIQQSCTNYCGIKLTSHNMKLCKIVREQRFRQETKISENHLVSCKGGHLWKLSSHQLKE